MSHADKCGDQDSEYDEENQIRGIKFWNMLKKVSKPYAAIRQNSDLREV